MASRSDIEAGKAHVTLYTKNSPLINGLKAAGVQLKAFGAGVAQVTMRLAKLGSAGLLAVGAGIGAAIAHFTKAGSELADMSARTGMAASTLAELKFAADQTGTSIEDVEGAIKRSQKSGKDFFQTAKAIAAIEDPAKRTQAAMEAWGKSGTKLLPMLNNLQELRQEARDKGLVPTDESVALADKLGDKFDTVFAQIKSAIFEIGAIAGPYLMPIADIIQQVLAVSINWIRTNESVLGTIKGIGDAFIGGDWALAGEIAVKELQIVFQSGLAVISKSITGILGGAIGKIGTDIIKGDLASAWDSTVGGMAAIWDTLVAGMAMAFRAAVQAIQSMLHQVITRFQETANLIAGLIEATGAPGSQQTGAAIRGASALAGAAGTTIDANLTGLGGVAGAIETATRNQAVESMTKAVEDLSGGADEASDELMRMHLELAELRKRAKEAREKGLAPDGAGGVGAEGAGPTGIPRNIQSIVTSSAAALARVGGRGRDPVVNKLEEMRKIDADVLKEIKGKDLLFVA